MLDPLQGSQLAPADGVINGWLEVASGFLLVPVVAVFQAVQLAEDVASGVLAVDDPEPLFHALQLTEEVGSDFLVVPEPDGPFHPLQLTEEVASDFLLVVVLLEPPFHVPQLTDDVGSEFPPVHVAQVTDPVPSDFLEVVVFLTVVRVEAVFQLFHPPVAGVVAGSAPVTLQLPQPALAFPVGLLL